MKTQRGIRPHIAIFGRRNAGKSSLLNAITRQDVAIVSEVAGTTTDPVEKLMEFLPLGPVVFIDTAGVDDEGALGIARVKRTFKVLEKTDVAILVADVRCWDKTEDELLGAIRKHDIPVIVVMNKADVAPGRLSNEPAGVPVVYVSALTGEGVDRLREAIIEAVPESFISAPAIVGDLIDPGDAVLLVVPIDMEAPKGRLILPQVQVIRDLLDSDACAIVVKEREIRSMLARLKEPPSLVVTDSQAFLKVAADVPENIRLTSFSILFARQKGDLSAFVQGSAAIDTLKSGSRVLVAEACTHHPIGDDIGRTKIPRWLAQYTGTRLSFDTVAGNDFPDNLSDYDLVIHCGSCTINRRLVLSRIMKCRAAGVPITNYGLAIAKSLGILDRALSPFPGVCDILKNKDTRCCNNGIAGK